MISGFAPFMESGGWALYALIAASFTAGYYLINQYMRQPGDIIVFWMRVVVIILLAPLVSKMQLPDNPWFYFYVVLTAIFGIGADIRTFDVAAKYGGGVLSRVMPVTVWGSFFLWFLFDPSLLANYAANPLRAVGIIAAIFGCVYFAMRLHKCEITKSAMRDMAPALAGYIMATVLNKQALVVGVADGDFTGAIYTYMYVQSIVGVLMLGPYLLFSEYRRKTPVAGWGRRMVLSASLMAGLVWLSHMIFKNYAVAYTPHPSYQSAVNLTAPLFIILFYKLVGHQEKEDAVSGMGIVASTALLVLMTI